MKKAQITIYLSISIALILSIFLSVFETARSAGLRVLTECAAESALSSAFAEYNRLLLSEYDIFFIDLSYEGHEPDTAFLSNRLSEYFYDNCEPAGEEHFLSYRDWYNIQSTSATIEGIRLATDYSGEVFRDQAIASIKEMVGFNQIADVQSWIGVYKEKQLDKDTYLEQSEKAKKEWEEYDANKIWSGNLSKSFSLPLERFFYTGNFFLEDIVMTASHKVTDVSILASERTLAKGENTTFEIQFNPVDELIFDEYILSKLGNYRNTRDNTDLMYEVEYVLTGECSDDFNLLKVLDILFYLRSAANLCSLSADSDTLEMLKTISEPLSALTKIPEPVITAFLLIIWAEAEAVFDVHALTDGKRVPLIKSVENFTLSLSGSTSEIPVEQLDGNEYFTDGTNETENPAEGTNGSDSIKDGLKYEDYLRILLAFIPPETKVFRVMDMIEVHIRNLTKNMNFRMDACVEAVEVQFNLETKYGHSFSANRKYGYYM